jgi:2-haloacid dehalogenase
MDSSNIKALIFDVFGTVVDWRQTLTKRLNSFLPKELSEFELEKFAIEWRKGYSDYINEFNNNKQSWQKIDDIHKRKLIQLLKDFKLINLMNESSINKLNKIWHQLDPWEDSVEGLSLLKNKYSIGTLSNGNFSLLLNMSKYSKLPWDFIFSGDIFLKYKPNKYVYKKATEYLGLNTNEVMLVAAHENDLLAAEMSGLKTAYIHRPFEYSNKPKEKPKNKFNYSCNSFVELSQLI